jgi:inward rectifier potassium channel
LISPYKEGKALMLRLANFRSNQLIDVEVQLYLSYNVIENDKEVRKFLLLNLERDNVAILVTSWTIVHPINEDSPIMNFNKDALENSGAEFLVLLKSFDDTFAQTVHSRTSYTASEIVENARFIKASYPSPSGILEFDLSKIGIYELI